MLTNQMELDSVASCFSGQTDLERSKFYERMGFRFLEDRRFNDDDCAVYRITRAQWLEATDRSELPGASS